MCIRASRSVACILLITTSASADFVGVTTVIKDDPDTEFLCTQGNGDFVPGPLTVCTVFATFTNPGDRLLSVGNANLQVYNGAIPDVFFQHQFNFTATAPSCTFTVFFPDLICDTFITIGYKCGPQPAGTDTTAPDDDFDASEFQSNGHVVGGWFTGQAGGYDPLDQGEAGNWPDLQVLFLQSSVAQGLSMSGDIDIFWEDGETGETNAEVDVPIECAAGCPDDYPCDDGDACTEKDQCIDGVCTGLPIGCDDGNPCTDDDCDPDTGCVNTPNDLNSCDDSDVCNGNEMCVGGTCQAGTPLSCNDANPCTDEVCDPLVGCIKLPNNDACDDGDACTTEDTCSNGECLGGPPLDCDDGDACTIGHCDPVGGCIGPQPPLDCDDGIPCTEDTCDSGSGCVNTPDDDLCLDGNLCTADLCEPGMGCVHVPVPDGTPADDGNPCTVDDMCVDGAPSSTPVQCPKGQVCDPASGGCVEDQDPCECVNGRVTLCHIPPGNPDNARTIGIGCVALDKHLAHGDHCGPCEDGGG